VFVSAFVGLGEVATLEGLAMLEETELQSYDRRRLAAVSPHTEPSIHPPNLPFP
jgi:hypothetical protein